MLSYLLKLMGTLVFGTSCYRQQIEDSFISKTEFDYRKETLTTEGTTID